MSQKNMAILVVSFDGYADIWDVFSLCINRFWKNREYKTYLVTNNLKPNYDGIEIIRTGDEVSWNYRVRKSLENISEKYVMLLLEDYLIAQNVCETKVSQAVEYMQSENLDYLRIVPIPKISSDKTKYAAEITDKMLYGVNLQAAIWKKDYLLKLLEGGEFNAWEFEARQKFSSESRIEGKCSATNDYVIYYLNGIIQGKWYKKTVDALADSNIHIDLGKRSVMTDKDMSRMNFRNFLARHIPAPIIRRVKPLAKKLGFKFVTE